MGSTASPQLQAAYSRLFELLPDSIHCCFDRYLRVVFASGSLLRQWNNAPDALVGKPADALLPHEVWAAVELRLQAALKWESSQFSVAYAAGEVLQVAVTPWGEEVAHGTDTLNDDGAPRVLMLGISAPSRKGILDEPRGNKEGLVAAIEAGNVGLWDIEREHLLLQLEDKAEQLSQVMRSVPEGVLLLDNLGHVLLTNPRAEQKLALLAAYDDEQRLTQLADLGLEALLTSPPEGQWHTVRAGRQMYEIIARPLESGPVPAGWVVVLRDVTAERAVQEQLQRQERLAAVGQLAAGIAHDFNNIMSIILIYAEMTSEAPGLTERERARTRTIMEQAQRATRMIRQILDFSRQSVFERQLLDLLPLLKEEEKLLKQTLPENIEIELAAARGEYYVKADPTRIQQMVMNLAVNARDAMPHGGQLRIAVERFTVAAGKHAPAPNMSMGEWVRIDMQDTGSGIQPEHMVHMFEPFFTTKERGKGTGLGLAQAHGIVAQHDGHIVATTEPGIGTTFSIFLPALPTTGEVAGMGRIRPPLPQGQGERVLLVEDDATLRGSLAELLELWNYRVVQAVNGEDALNRLMDDNAQASEPMALIVSDVVMPLLGGVALVKALRRQGLKTPVILMSGHPIGEEHANWQALGVQAWLNKPPSSWQLAQAMAQALRHS